jgi:hypothetical protein
VEERNRGRAKMMQREIRLNIKDYKNRRGDHSKFVKEERVYKMENLELIEVAKERIVQKKISLGNKKHEEWFSAKDFNVQ